MYIKKRDLEKQAGQNDSIGYTGIDLAGVITANSGENKSEAKKDEIREFARAL